MAVDTIAFLAQVFVNLYTTVLGQGLIIGIFLLFTYALITAYVGISAQAATTIGIPLIYLLIQTGLPEYAMPIALFIVSILITLAILRVLRR